MRRAAQEALTKVAVQRYHPILTKEATMLASGLLAIPEKRDQHFQRAVASTMMSILYDFPTFTSTQDNAVQDTSRALNSSLRAVAGTSLVEFFPWMIYVPQRSVLSPQFKEYISHLRTGLQSGRRKLWNSLLSVPRGFSDYSMVSRLTSYVPHQNVWMGGRHDNNKFHRRG